MIPRLFNSMSVRVQMTCVFLSFVGVIFGAKTYLHVKADFGHSASLPFMQDFIWQIVIAIIVNAVVAYVLFHIVTLPIKRLSQAMREISENNLELHVPYQQQATEIGDMARLVEFFRKNAIEKKTLEAAQAEQDERMKREKQQATHDLLALFEHSVQHIITDVVAAVEKLKISSAAISSTFHSVNQKSLLVLGAAQATASNVNDTASSIRQMAASTEEVASQIHHSVSAVEDVIKAKEQADRIAASLSNAATSISQMVEFISAIANQINLLALNATIESARAGEAGRGFAVVAGEVKLLANETAQRTSQIANYVGNIQTISADVSQAMGLINESILKLEQGAAQIAGAMQQQSAATREIEDSITDTAHQATEISQDMSHTMSFIKQAQQMTEDFSTCFAQLMQDVETLQTQTRHFVHEIKAA